MEGRIWQRGSSKNRGQSNSRFIPTTDPESDPMMSSIQKSQIANIVSGARASLQEPSRPFTPGDMPRHLFSGDDYSNRPGSSYKMKSVVGQAIEEFNRDIYSQGTMSTNITTTASLAGRKQSSGRLQGVQNKDNNIIDVLKKAEQTKLMRGSQLPSLPAIDLNTSKNMKPFPKVTIKSVSTSGPIKPPTQQQVQQQQPATTDLGISGSKISQRTESNIKKPIIKNQIKSQKSGKDLNSEDYSDLIKEENKYEESMRYVQNQTDNLLKLQEIQQQIKQANRQKQNEEGEMEDEYEDYFANEMIKDLEGVESYEQRIDYYEAVKKIQDKVQLNETQIDTKSKNVDDYMESEDDYLLDQSESQMEQNVYQVEYAEVIVEMSRICQILSSKNKEQKHKIKQIEEEILELCPRIWTLADGYMKQNDYTKSQCFLETLMKGSFSLLGVKFPKPVLRLSACNIHLFFKIFDKVYILPNDQQKAMDFKKTFTYLFETMRGLLIYAKEGMHDLCFKEENLIPLLGKIMNVCFVEQAEFILKFLTQTINKKDIINDDMMHDLVNYTVGSIKCFTQSNSEVQKEAIKQKYIPLMGKCITKALDFGKNQTKKSMMLVQITGTLRNLIIDDDSNQQVCQFNIIPKLINILRQFNGHKELMLNVSRILSKLSLDHKCCLEILRSNCLSFLLDLAYQFKESTAFVIRVTFLLGNLTTYYDDARIALGALGMKKVLELILFYYDKDEKQEKENGVPSSKEQKKRGMDMLGNLEDCIIKIIRLLANLATDEDYTQQSLIDNKSLVQQFVSKTLAAISRRTLEQNEEFILNAISSLTNLLFFDTPQSQLLSNEIEINIFHGTKNYILETQNEEIQIESVRLLSNLSRHPQICEEYVSDKNFLDALIIVLDHTLRDLVFYSIGIIINISLHPASRLKVLDKQVIPKLIDAFKDSNIEDLDLSKVAAKALHNMVSENNYWSIETLKKLDDVLSNIGEELDSIMEVATEREQLELKGLRDLVNALINDMPEPMFDCIYKECGRKFKNKEDLEKHMERRHGHKKE